MPGMDGLAGGAGDQGQSADRHDPDHDVHLAGGRAVRRPGARARRDGRAAETGAAGRCIEGVVRAASVAGSARHGPNPALAPVEHGSGCAARGGGRGRRPAGARRSRTCRTGGGASRRPSSSSRSTCAASSWRASTASPPGSWPICATRRRRRPPAAEPPPPRPSGRRCGRGPRAALRLA